MTTKKQRKAKNSGERPATTLKRSRQGAAA